MSISYEPEQRYLNPLLFCLSALEGQFYNLVYYWKLSHVDVVKGGNIYSVDCASNCTPKISTPLSGLVTPPPKNKIKKIHVFI